MKIVYQGLSEVLDAVKHGEINIRDATDMLVEKAGQGMFWSMLLGGALWLLVQTAVGILLK